MNILATEMQIVKYVVSLPAWECGLKHPDLRHPLGRRHRSLPARECVGVLFHHH